MNAFVDHKLACTPLDEQPAMLLLLLVAEDRNDNYRPRICPTGTQYFSTYLRIILLDIFVHRPRLHDSSHNVDSIYRLLFQESKVDLLL